MIDYTGLAILVSAVSSAGISIATFVRAGYVARRIDTLEINTNSIKDALVKATSDASFAKGHAIGQAEERANPQVPAVKPIDGS